MATRKRCRVPCLLGLLLSALVGVNSGAELSFTLEPSDIIAVQEQPLMLHCQVDGIPPITTQWRRNGLLLLEDQNCAMFANGSLLIGQFQRTKLDGSSDEGDYECVAQNSFGLVVSRKARVQAASSAGREMATAVQSISPPMGNGPLCTPAPADARNLLKFSPGSPFQKPEGLMNHAAAIGGGPSAHMRPPLL
ncbi:hypothetical protein AAFF_G00267930 [Aldrovandia affinis]|uniref:Ig-like domain-containing protein n=1 Tax=Aldrovandia affinis TaxID=143900 RepID=A0AAD7SS06_9TELE|nr:hypothetical protein AAFF_G00267930 [Aldrovandia affinis]